MSEIMATFAHKIDVFDMATMTKSASRRKPSTLDVLWALYQSQPKRVRRAFLEKVEDQQDMEEFQQWETDLREIRYLKDNWDGEGASHVDRAAIRHTNRLLTSLDGAVACRVRLFPTPMGAILIKLETKYGRLKCEVGDELMSYFVKRSGQETEHHSFEPIDDNNISTLKLNMQSLL